MKISSGRETKDCAEPTSGCKSARVCIASVRTRTPMLGGLDITSTPTAERKRRAVMICPFSASSSNRKASLRQSDVCKRKMDGFLKYAAGGLAAYFLIRLLHTKTGANPAALDFLWNGIFSEIAVFIIAVVFWPVVLALSFLCFMGSYACTRSTTKQSARAPEPQSNASPYSHLSFEELLAAQKHALNDLEARSKEAEKKSG